MRTLPRLALLTLSLTACQDGGDDTDTDAVSIFADPDALPPLRGPGGPARTFTEAELFTGCAPLNNGPTDVFKHHNMVMPYRGHLVRPWAPEFGNGGIAFFDVSDPCAPALVGEGLSVNTRETHAVGFVHLPDTDPNAGDWAVTNMYGQLSESGIQFWDISDVSAPEVVFDLGLEGVFYPDSYTSISLSVYWQYPYVYVAAAKIGVFVVDATDPRAPVTIGHYVFPDERRAGGVFAMGDTLLVTTAEGELAAMLDVRDPTNPIPIPGGDFETKNSEGEARETYHGNRVGPWALFARKEGGGGPIVYDISDPSDPTYVADAPVDGNGGYVYYDEGFLFTGDSNLSHIIDARDWSDLKVVFTGTNTMVVGEELDGDLDTMTPYGNVAVMSVDDPGTLSPGDTPASIMVPWQTAPDATGPLVLHTEPADGATGVSTSGKLGIGFNEFVEPTSIFPGSVRLVAEDGTEIDGWGTAQEATGSYVTKQPLDAGTTYTLTVLAGGARDLNGNALAEDVTVTFTTAE